MLRLPMLSLLQYHTRAHVPVSLRARCIMYQHVGDVVAQAIEWSCPGGFLGTFGGRSRVRRPHQIGPPGKLCQG